jgi:hypothetical protein
MHVTCFSSTAELPSQCKRYAACTGYAIGFDRDALQAWCTARAVSLFPIIYDPCRQTNLIKEFFENEK